MAHPKYASPIMPVRTRHAEPSNILPNPTKPFFKAFTNFDMFLTNFSIVSRYDNTNKQNAIVK